MSYADITIAIAGVIAIAAVFTFFTRVSQYLTLREHAAYQKAMESTMVDVDRRLIRLENKILNGPK